MRGASALLLGLAALALSSQPSAPAPIPAPLRSLTWGQLNFLHTTDVHGWYSGHLQEPSFSADWGDYISFARRMREKAEANGQDLLVIDTGDRVEGNGLYDSSQPKSKYASSFLREQHIDLLCSGNHELYRQNASEVEYLVTVPDFKGNYISSNIDIRDPHSGQLVPLAPRFKKFTTKLQGIRIVAFGFLFDFKGNYNNTVVTPVGDTIKQEWFQEAISDRDVDLFLVIGHVPAHSREYSTIFKAIRSAQWDTPIQFFGGHQHIRDYAKYDNRAYALASGRFLETIGFASLNGLARQSATKASPSFNRRYIDSNLQSFYYHTGLDESTFDTEQGKTVSKLIDKARHTLQLDREYGCSPKNLWTSRSSYPSENSIYSWLENDVLPSGLKEGLSVGKNEVIALLNTGAIRFDILKGRFTRDSAYIISPFVNQFRYARNLPRDKASKILDILNRQPSVLSPSTINEVDYSHLAPPIQWGGGPNFDPLYHPRLNTDQVVFKDAENLIPGYTTKDDAGDDGDDTVHSAISFYRVPNCFQASIRPADENHISPTEEDDNKIDIIYVDFLEPFIAAAAKVAGIDFDAKKDAELYMPGVQVRSLITDWISQNWKCS